jgi:hypothetical protein
LLNWIKKLENPNQEAVALATWHLLKLKIVENRLYAYSG